MSFAFTNSAARRTKYWVRVDVRGEAAQLGKVRDRVGAKLECDRVRAMVGVRLE